MLVFRLSLATVLAALSGVATSTLEASLRPRRAARDTWRSRTSRRAADHSLSTRKRTKSA
jgi:hypothetical protein